MANQEQLDILKQGVETWNQWREEQLDVKPDLRGVFFYEPKFTGADLSKVNLTEANLTEATLVGTNLTNATLTGCCIYGIPAWNVQLEGAKQDNLVITPGNEPTITIDNLKIAQFIYLLLNVGMTITWILRKFADSWNGSDEAEKAPLLTKQVDTFSTVEPLFNISEPA